MKYSGSKIFKIFILSIVLLGTLGQTAQLYGAPPKLKTSVFFKRQYINLANIANVYGFRFTADGSRLLISGKYHKFSFTAEKNNASFNGVKIVLAHAVYKNRGSYYISKIDYDTVLLPLINRRNMKKHKVKVVYLDPGHGGKDPGATRRGSAREKDLNLTVSKHLYNYLKKQGFDVKMTRSDDTFVTLAGRSKMANEFKADLFVSVHT